MQIQWKDIDSEIAAQLFRNTASRKALGLVSSEVSSLHPISFGRVAAAIIGTLFAYLSSMILLGIAVENKISDWLIGVFFIALLFAIPLCVINWVRTGNLFRMRRGQKPAALSEAALWKNFQEMPFLPEELDALRSTIATLTFSPQEHLYLQTLASLLALNRRSQLDDTRCAALLDQLNGLMASERELKPQVQSLKSLLQADKIQQIESEQEALQDRLNHASDPEARRNLERSLAICRDRLMGMRELAPLLERLDAQRQVVQQTLASLDVSLRRLLLTKSSDVNRGSESLDMDGVQQSIAEIQRETRSTEQAVQEVIALRAF